MNEQLLQFFSIINPLVTYEIPNYMYKLNLLLLETPEYKVAIESHGYYEIFLKKTSNDPIDLIISSLPFLVFEDILNLKLHDVNFCQYLLDSNIIRNLLVLLSVLTNQKNRKKKFSPQVITKHDMIKQLKVIPTSNFQSKGTGFGNGNIQRVWNVEFTKWKALTEKYHVISVLILLKKILLKFTESTESVKMTKMLTELYQNSCLIYTIFEYLKNNSSKINESYNK
jgi:hypothetical protein